MVVPQMPASAACIHAINPTAVHLNECVDAVDGPIQGGCAFVAATDVVAGEGQMTGVMVVAAFVYSASTLAENPVSATIACYIKVNFAAQPGAVVAASGTVVVVGGGVITYTSNSVTDFVQLCQDVDYGWFNTSQCSKAETFEIPPPIVGQIVDPEICPVIALAAPGAGPVFINSQGDVWIDGEGFYDCPTYGNVFGFPPNGLHPTPPAASRTASSTTLRVMVGHTLHPS